MTEPFKTPSRSLVEWRDTVPVKEGVYETRCPRYDPLKVYYAKWFHGRWHSDRSDPVDAAMQVGPSVVATADREWRGEPITLRAFASETGINVPTALWLDICEFIEDHVDVRDGSDGVPLPNRAMSLVNAIQREVKNAAPQGEDAPSEKAGDISVIPAGAAPSNVASTACSDTLLEQLCKELGWQGGTRHQALAEVENLRKAAQSGRVWSEKLKAMTAWLDENQTDVWRRGLWDAINKAQQASLSS